MLRNKNKSDFGFLMLRTRAPYLQLGIVFLRLANWHLTVTTILLLLVGFNIPSSTSINITDKSNLKNHSVFDEFILKPTKKVTFNSSKKSQVPCFINRVGNGKNHEKLLLLESSSISPKRFFEVACLNNAKQPVPGIPDLILNGITYSSIDFQTFLAQKSAVGFAIDKFIFEVKQMAMVQRPSTADQDDNPEQGDAEDGDAMQEEMQTEREISLLTTYWKLYGAMSVALRILNNQPSKSILTILKGPAFVLDFQRARLDGNVRKIMFNLKQILKNCLNCTNVETKRLALLAKASGVNDNTFFASMAEEDTVNSNATSSNKSSTEHVFLSGGVQNRIPSPTSGPLITVPLAFINFLVYFFSVC